MSRTTGLKKLNVYNETPPVLADLHRSGEGANQKCCSSSGTKKLLRRGHTIRPAQAVFEMC